MRTKVLGYRNRVDVNMAQRYIDSHYDNTPIEVQDYLREQKLVLSILTKKDVELAPRNASLSQLTIDSLTENDSDFKKLRILGCRGKKDYRPKSYLRPASKRQFQSFYIERKRFRTTTPVDSFDLDHRLSVQRIISETLKQRLERDSHRLRMSSAVLFK